MFNSSSSFGGGGSSSSGFGGFNQANNNTAARTGFGGFGQNNTSTGGGFGNNTGGGFGQSNTGGGFGNSTGGFGQTGGTTGFGQTANTGFGQNAGGSTGGFGAAATASTFGQPAAGGFGQQTGGGGLFGQTSAAGGAFGGGAANSTFGGAVSTTNTGTGHTPFKEHTERTPQGVKEAFQNICAMNEYMNFSTEELRLQDYLANRKQPGAAGASGFGNAGTTGFGQTSAAGGFGNTGNTGTTGFGQTSAAGGGFGQTSTATGFGQTNSTGGFGQTGTNTGGFGANTFGQTNTGGGFGQTSTGGAFGQTNNTGSFGASAGFGANASKPAFGQSTTAGFGQTSTAGGFGGGAFGASATTPAFGQTSAGGFGQTSTATTGFGGGFAAKTGAATGGFGGLSTGGGFGQSNTTGFGQSTNTGFGQTSAAGTGLGFGANTSKPAFGTFGQTNTSAANATGGLFGSTAGATGGFGQTNTNTAGGGLFGANTNANTNTGGGLFGSNNAAGNTGGGLFGAKPATSAAGGGLFGSTTNTNTNTGSGLFGGNTNTGNTGSGLFGSNTNNANANTGGELFGSNNNANTNTSGGLFGSNNVAGNTGGGLFGAKPATGAAGGGLFGASNTNTNAGGGLFGTNTNNASAGGGLFGGPKPTFGQAATGTTGGGLFGSNPGATGLGFGGLQNQQQTPGMQQPLQVNQLSAQIDRQPYGASSLFDTSKLAGKTGLFSKTGSSHLTATPLRSSIVEQSTVEKERELKKRGLSLHSIASPQTANSTRLRSRGFAAPTTAKRSALLGSPAAMASPSVAHVNASYTLAGSNGTPGRESVALFGRDGFLPSTPQTPRSNVKRLVINHKPAGTGFAAGSSSTLSPPKPQPQSQSVAVVPVAAAAAEPASPWAGVKRTQSMAADPEDTLKAAADTSSKTEPQSKNENEEEVYDGVYWMAPSLDELRSMPNQKLRAVKGFTVGRMGYGQVEFKEPVDLTSVGSLGSIAGGVVLFDDRVCTVYPDESNKPPRGQGLNVPAVISLENCWPLDRETGKPITKVDDVRVRKHHRRLKKTEDTEFINFVEGIWVFRVEHFSRYGLDDDMYDDDDDDGGDDDDDDYVMVKAGEESKKQGFSKATAASAVGAQGHMGGSRAVAQSQPKEEVNESSDGDADMASDEQDAAADQQLPASLTQRGAMRSESMGHGPAMRQSLFPKKPSEMDMDQAAESQSGKRAQDDSTKEDQQGVSAAPAKSGFERGRSQPGGNPFVLKDKAVPKRGRRASCARGGRDHMSCATTATGAASLAASSIDALDLPSPSKYLRTSESRVMRDLLAQTQPYSASVTHGRSGLSADAGMMMARSFRAAFGPQGQLMYLQSGSSRAKGASTTLVIDNLARHVHAAPGGSLVLAQSAADSSNAALEVQRQMHLSMVRAQWEHSHISIPPSVTCPVVTFREGTTVSSVLSTLARINNGTSSDALPEEESRILELAAVLFDDLPPEDNQDELSREQLASVQAIRRRQGLTRWLMSAVHESVGQDLVQAGECPSRSAASAFALLSGNKIAAACLGAIAYRDYRLATLISQCGSGAVGGGGSDAQFQEFLRMQFNRLEEVGDRDAFPSSYRRVYELLSGNVEWEAAPANSSSSPGSYVSQGLDWKRVFGMTLWYAQTPADPISGAVRQYERMFMEGSLSSGVAVPSPVAPPLPSWLLHGDEHRALRASALYEFEQADTSLATRATALARNGVWDVAFQLLKLYSEPTMALDRALLSESFTAARGDSRLAAVLAWLLSAVGQCRGFDDAQMVAGGKIVSLAYDSMLVGWAFQLETLGLWQWSCFLLLQLSSDMHKSHAIRALIDRSLDGSTPSSALVPADSATGLMPVPKLGADSGLSAFEQQVLFVRSELHIPEQWLYDSYASRSRYDRGQIETRSGFQQQPAFMTGYQAKSSMPAGSFTSASSSFFRQSSVFGNMAVGAALDSAAEATLREIAWLISAGHMSSAHLLVLQKIAPDAVLRGDYRLLSKVLSFLDPTTAVASGGACVSLEDWVRGGQVYKSFLVAVDDLPKILRQFAAAKLVDEQSTGVQLVEQVKQIYAQMVALLSVLPSLSARFDSFSTSRDVSLGFYDGTEAFWYSAEETRELRVKYSVAISEMATVVTGQIRQMEACFPELSDFAAGNGGRATHQQLPTANPAALPLAEDMRILRTYQMAQTCFESLVTSGLEA